ncbi:MAG: hypothetical protein R2795_00665 [Saprospiraceae bacterium]
MGSITRILFFLLCGSILSMAQVSGPLTAGAASAAMGGAGVTLSGVPAAWSNPAGIASLESAAFALYGEQRYGLESIRQVSATGALPVGKHSAVGLVVGYFGFTEFNEQRIGMVYGRKLSDGIRLGAQLYTLGTRIPDYGSKQLVSAEVGIQGDISRAVSFGARVANPVRVEILNEEYLPSVLSIGINYHPGKQLMLLAEAEKNLIYPVRIRAGLEYQFLDALFLRMGVATQPSLLSFGVGYTLRQQWRLDVSAAWHQYLGFTPGIGLVFTR